MLNPAMSSDKYCITEKYNCMRVDQKRSLQSALFEALNLMKSHMLFICMPEGSECSWSCESRHVHRSTAVAVQLGAQLGKLVPRRSRRSYTPFVVFSETLWFSPPWQCPTAHTAQQTCNLLQNLIGKRWTISRTVQIWHPVIFICSPSWRSTC